MNRLLPLTAALLATPAWDHSRVRVSRRPPHRHGLPLVRRAESVRLERVRHLRGSLHPKGAS